MTVQHILEANMILTLIEYFMSYFYCSTNVQYEILPLLYLLEKVRTPHDMYDMYQHLSS